MTHPLTPREKVADRDVEALRVERLDQLSAWETYVDDQPKRDKAHQKVRWAVESGKLVPPEVCEKCGKNAGRGKDGRRLLQGHHDDYDKPLDVVWLCIICHRSVTPYNPRRGTRANAARLFEEDAIFIRTSRRNNRELAAMFGVDFTAIQQLKAGKTWAHVPSYEALLAENAALRAEREGYCPEGAELPTWEELTSYWHARATEAERKLAGAAEWRPIETFTGSGQNESVMVAVPNGEGGFIVGEAWRCVMAEDDDYRGPSGWWWAGTSPGDYNHDPIHDMNHGDPMFWLPLPPAPGAEDE